MKLFTSDKDRLQNEFTAYLTRAMRRARYDYIHALDRKAAFEIPYDELKNAEQVQFTQLSISVPRTMCIEDDIVDARLFQLLQQLTHLEHTVLTLAMCYNLKNREIAKILHKSRSSVSHAHNRALNKLRKGMMIQ